LLALAGSTAQAANITVDETTCTLAEAITSANNDSAAGNGCVNGSGTDTITLQQDVLLAAALPNIISTVIIQGGGHKIDGQNNSAVGSVLKISTASGNLTLNQATVTGGNASSGGGIYASSSTVTLNDCTVSGNTASSSTSSPRSGGGIFADSATVTLTNSTVIGNGAAGVFGGEGGAIVA
jgi:hypothetical protein